MEQINVFFGITFQSRSHSVRELQEEEQNIVSRSATFKTFATFGFSIEIQKHGSLISIQSQYMRKRATRKIVNFYFCSKN